MTTVPPVLDALSLNRYHLKVKGCTAPLDVESFQGREGLSTRYRYDVVFTSADRDITPSVMLMKNVTFIMQTLPQAAFRRTIAPEVQRTVYGVMTRFSRLSVSADEATYSLTFEPRLSLLDNSRRSAIYQNLSVPEVVEKILRENHNWPGWLFEFRLSNTYPQREIITQFMLSDAEFISRLLSEVGIWFNFTQDSETGHEVVLFGDSGRGWQYDVSVPAVNPAGMHDNRAESVWNLQAHHAVTERSVSTHDYNYRTADAIMDVQADLTHDDDKTTYGNDYHYTDGFLSEGDEYNRPDSNNTESGYFYACLRHERQLNRQHRLSLDSNSTLIAPGQVLKAEGNTSQAFANGMLVTAIESSASRDSHYKLKAEGIVYRDAVSFRPPEQPRARITVPLTARITSSLASDIYSHIDKMGRYTKGKINGKTFSGWFGMTNICPGDYVEMAVMPSSEGYLTYAIANPEQRTLSLTPKCHSNGWIYSLPMSFVSSFGVLFIPSLLITLCAGMSWLPWSIFWYVLLSAAFGISIYRNAKKEHGVHFELYRRIAIALGLPGGDKYDLGKVSRKKKKENAWIPRKEGEIPMPQDQWNEYAYEYFYYY